jgi:hypothetical protein
MLQGYPFPAILVEEPVGVTLTEQTADISNTDESTEDIADRYFTSFVSTAIPSPANILLKPS